MNIFFPCLPPHHRHWQNLDQNSSCICNFADYLQICHYHISGHFCKDKILWEGHVSFEPAKGQKGPKQIVKPSGVNSSKKTNEQTFFYLTTLQFKKLKNIFYFLEE